MAESKSQQIASNVLTMCNSKPSPHTELEQRTFQASRQAGKPRIEKLVMSLLCIHLQEAFPQMQIDNHKETDKEIGWRNGVTRT